MNVRTTPPSLLMRMRDHSDQQAWEMFCEVYGALVYGYCRKRNLDANDSADISQEVLLRVARGIRSFEYDRSKGRFRDWLSRIVHNEISRWFSRKPSGGGSSKVGVHEPNENNLWGEHFESHILEAALNVAKDHFEDHTWRAFELVWIENRPSPEVASMIERPLDFVYTAKSRVLKRLSLEVERLAEDAMI